MARRRGGARRFSPERLALQLAEAEALLAARVSEAVWAHWRWMVKLDDPPDLERFCVQLSQARRRREALLARDAALSEAEQERLQGLLRLEMALLRGIQALGEDAGAGLARQDGGGGLAREEAAGRSQWRRLGGEVVLLGVAAELEGVEGPGLPGGAVRTVQRALQAVLDKQPHEALRALEPLLWEERHAKA